ncbi:glycosyltransferase family 61 protein [Candidatus Babeliales bacterium]|nr:glycosyltransferase family 61 protein [Candidatus Babeliales bacterium]
MHTKLAGFFLACGLLTESAYGLWFDVVPAVDLCAKRPDISYIKVFDQIPFHFVQSPYSMGEQYHASKGFFEESFIVKIPNGRVFSQYGYVIEDNFFMKELVWKGLTMHLDNIEKIDASAFTYHPGKVVVIAQLAFFNYYHWLSEVLGRLALLEMAGVPYDYVYVPMYKNYMKETLELWGIDTTTQVIQPYAQNYALQAQELIVPSMVSNVSCGFTAFSCYPQEHILHYVRQRLLIPALQQKITKKFSSRIFISRKDAPERKVLNEDEVFERFAKCGFERYELEKLSVVEQIHLFNQAEIVVSPQGTGPANILFSRPGTVVVELIQKLNDTTMYYLSQICTLNYLGVPTASFTTDWREAYQDTTMSLELIDDLIAYLDL